MESIYDVSLPELQARVEAAGQPRYRAKQVWEWTYRRLAASYDEMSNVPASLRARVARELPIPAMETVREQLSDDGLTRKKLLRLHDGKLIESVLMLYDPRSDSRGRATVCVSSQAGCAMGCYFCATGQGGFERNLTTGEIVAQIIGFAREQKLARASGAAGAALTNVVFMGMGEPLANYRNVVPAIDVMLDDFGFDLSRRRVTLSTSGFSPQILRLAQECNVALAVSLHAPNDALRNELVPINRKHPIEELLQACWTYLDAQNGRSITFEYVMLDGVNDSDAHALELARLLKGRAAKVNLIPFNHFPGTRYRRSDPQRISRFRDLLNARGVIATTRRTRGDDIDAACGQLVGRVHDRTTVRLGSKLIGVAVEA